MISHRLAHRVYALNLSNDPSDCYAAQRKLNALPRCILYKIGKDCITLWDQLYTDDDDCITLWIDSIHRRVMDSAYRGGYNGRGYYDYPRYNGVSDSRLTAWRSYMAWLRNNDSDHELAAAIDNGDYKLPSCFYCSAGRDYVVVIDKATMDSIVLR
jgi:hypothetical protein